MTMDLYRLRAEEAVRRFYALDRHALVFRRGERGVAARLGRIIVLPARGEPLPPLGVPVRPRRLTVRERFILAHGGWDIPAVDFYATVLTDGRVRIPVKHSTGYQPDDECVVPATEPARLVGAVGQIIWGKLVRVGATVLFAPHLCRCGALATESSAVGYLCRPCLDQEKKHWPQPDNSVDGDGGLSWYHSFEGDED